MELNMSYWLQFIVEVVSKGHIQHYLQIRFVIIIMEEMEDIWSYKPQTSSKRDTHRMDDVTIKYICGTVREFLEFDLDIFATSPSQNCKKKFLQSI